MSPTRRTLEVAVERMGHGGHNLPASGVYQTLLILYCSGSHGWSLTWDVEHLGVDTSCRCLARLSAIYGSFGHYSPLRGVVVPRRNLPHTGRCLAAALVAVLAAEIDEKMNITS